MPWVSTSMSAPADMAVTPRASRLRSVGTKLAGSTIVLIVAVTAGVYLTLSRSQRENLLQSKEMSAVRGDAAVRRLVRGGRRVRRRDRDRRRAHDARAQRRRRVRRGVEQRTASGECTKRFGELRRRDGVEPLGHAPDSDHAWTASPRASSSRRRSTIARAALVGATVVAFSLARENAGHHEPSSGRPCWCRRRSLSGSSCCSSIMARVVVVGPLGKLVAAAQELEHGGKGEVDIRTSDEVGQLAVAFRQMGGRDPGARGAHRRPQPRHAFGPRQRRPGLRDPRRRGHHVRTSARG